jgi:hypothetical protein
MSKRTRSKANIPIHRESLFWILSPVFCLLPKPPLLPSLPGIHESIMQNKPNSPNDKTTATSYATQIYSNIPLRSAPKKQTQTKPIPPTQYAIPNTQYEKQTQSNPTCRGVATSEPGPHTPNGQPDHQIPTTHGLFHHQQKH